MKNYIESISAKGLERSNAEGEGGFVTFWGVWMYVPVLLCSAVLCRQRSSDGLILGTDSPTETSKTGLCFRN